MDTLNGEINLASILKMLIKNKLIILLFVAIGIVFSLAVTFLPSEKYESEAVIQVGTLSGGKLLEDPEQLVSTINYKFSDKYPFLKLTVIENTRLIDVKNYSSNKDQALKSIGEITSGIISDHQNILDVAKNKLEAKIKDYESTVNRFIQLGQQVVILQQSLLALQDELGNFSPSHIVMGPTVSPAKKTSVLLSITIGIILGIFLGVSVACIKEWWLKNKANVS